MLDTPICTEALQDHELYNHLITHRKWYTGYTYMDYEQLGHKTISFIPPDNLLQLYRDDYTDMCEEMIYRTPKDFDDLIEELKRLQGLFRTKFLEGLQACRNRR